MITMGGENIYFVSGSYTSSLSASFNWDHQGNITLVLPTTSSTIDPTFEIKDSAGKRIMRVSSSADNMLTLGEETSANRYWQFTKDGEIRFSKAGSTDVTAIDINDTFKVKTRTRGGSVSTKTFGEDLTVNGNVIPGTDATHTLGSARKRWARLYTASTIDVSGSQLIICAPSASAVGDSFEIAISGSIRPAGNVDKPDYDLGSESHPWRDMYIHTGSIIYVDTDYDVGHVSRKISFSRKDVERLREGKPLRATDSRDDDTPIKAKLTGGADITGSLKVTADAEIVSGSFTKITSDLIPDQDDTHNLGSSTNEWNDLYIDGTAYIDEGVITTGYIATVNGQMGEVFQAFTDQDTSPDVRSGNKWKTANTRATAVVALDRILDGQEVTIVVNDANTDFTHGARGSAGELRLNGARNWTTCAAGDTITFVGMDVGSSTVVAFEKCRSDNT